MQKLLLPLILSFVPAVGYGEPFLLSNLLQQQDNTKELCMD